MEFSSTVAESRQVAIRVWEFRRLDLKRAQENFFGVMEILYVLMTVVGTNMYTV